MSDSCHQVRAQSLSALSLLRPRIFNTLLMIAAAIFSAWAFVAPLAASAQITASPASLSWYKVAVGSAGGPKVATLTNASSASVNLSSIALIGSGAADFTIYQKTCGATLAGSASCTVTILFKPKSAGTFAAVLAFNDNASDSPQEVALSGIGTGGTVTGTAAASPSSLSWYTVAVTKAGGPKVATLTNTGTVALTISSIGVTGADPVDFAIYQKTCGATLAVAASCTVTVLFKPAISGTRTASLTFGDNATSSPQQVALSGLGTGSAPQGTATVTPSSLSWTLVNLGDQGDSKIATLTNTGAIPITINSIGFTGADPGDFIITQNTCGATLAASASCTVFVTFAPTASGTRTATLSFADNASGSPQQVSLSGVGNSGSSLSPATATLNEGATQQFTASLPSTWRESCGSVSQTGLYTAPLTPGTCTVFADPLNGETEASASVTVTSPITLTPATVNLHALNAQQFTASQPVRWTSSCGSVSASGMFTAPASPGPCTITATASHGFAYTAVAAANVDLVNYTAWKGGGGLTGAQTDELLLTPSNVNTSSFGLVWQTNVDDYVNAQPLYMNALTINGIAHNVVFIATANDSVYALDGDTGVQLWQVSLLPPGATAVRSSLVQFSDQSQIGVLSTPVLDPSTNTLYVVSETSEQNATYLPNRLHALDVTTGQEKFGGPVLISNPQLAPMHKLQRPGLTLANGSVYVAIGSLNDAKPYNGMLLAFNAATLAQTAAFVVTPTGDEGGIWMGGAAPSVDENGDLYVATGNGVFDGVSNFSEAAVKLSPTLQLLDYFAPWNYEALSDKDTDLGSGDVMIAPDQNGQYPHELIVCGKPTPVYVLDRENMGHAGATSNNIIQTLDNEVGALGPGASTVYACYTAPAMWQQNVYFGGKYDVLKMFSLAPTTGLLSSTPISQDTLTFGYPGADPVVSANGDTNGIVWTIDPGTGTLRANDATNVANLLYSGQIPGGAIRWTIPTVANGHVYVAEQGMVYGYGLK